MYYHLSECAGHLKAVGKNQSVLHIEGDLKKRPKSDINTESLIEDIDAMSLRNHNELSSLKEYADE